MKPRHAVPGRREWFFGLALVCAMGAACSGLWWAIFSLLARALSSPLT